MAAAKAVETKRTPSLEDLVVSIGDEHEDMFTLLAEGEFEGLRARAEAVVAEASKIIAVSNAVLEALK